jgi:hypothetical protein
MGAGILIAVKLLGNVTVRSGTSPTRPAPHERPPGRTSGRVRAANRLLYQGIERVESSKIALETPRTLQVRPRQFAFAGLAAALEV